MKVMIIESVEGYCREFYFRVKCVIYARMQNSYEESGEDIVDIEMKAKFTAHGFPKCSIIKSEEYFHQVFI